MKEYFLILMLALTLETYSPIIINQPNVLNLQFLSGLQNKMKVMSISELKEMIDVVNAYETNRRLEESKKKQELESIRKMKEENEMKRQKIFIAYLAARAGKSSFLNDFFSNRL